MIKPNRTVQLLGTGNSQFACCWRLIRPRCSRAITPQVHDNWLRNPQGAVFGPFPHIRPPLPHQEAKPTAQTTTDKGQGYAKHDDPHRPRRPEGLRTGD